jgi:hypothetical protein
VFLGRKREPRKKSFSGFVVSFDKLTTFGQAGSPYRPADISLLNLIHFFLILSFFSRRLRKSGMPINQNNSPEKKLTLSSDHPFSTKSHLKPFPTIDVERRTGNVNTSLIDLKVCDCAFTERVNYNVPELTGRNEVFMSIIGRSPPFL